MYLKLTFLLFSFVLSSCYSIKNFSDDNLNVLSAYQFLETKEKWTLTCFNGVNFFIKKKILHKDSMTFIVVQSDFHDHPEGKEKFKKHEGYNPRAYLHLSTDLEIDSDSITLAYKDITQVMFHDRKRRDLE